MDRTPSRNATALPRRAGAALCAGVLLTGMAACSSGAKPPSPTSSSASSTATLSAPSSASPSTSSASSGAAGQQSLGGECSTILSLSAVELSLGRRVVGRTAFVVNLPDRKIGLLARVNCRYGIGKAVKRNRRTVVPPPLVEVSVSLYATENQASGRVAATVAAWRDSGARQTAVPMGQDTATLLTGYGQPLLVVAHRQRTVAVTVAAALMKGRNPAAVMSDIAAKALRNSSG
jgi:hypothetical protein